MGMVLNKCDITEFKLTGPISLCGIGDKERANPFAHNTTVTALDLSGTTGWPTVEFGDGTITDRIAGVPEECFSGCTALTRIVLPAEAKAIGFAAFQNCTALTATDLSHITHIGNTAFKNSGLAGALTLAETSYIGANAFNQCEKLSRATLSRATVIGESAFAQCPALTSVDMPQVQHVGNSAFNACHTLAEVNLPRATRLGNYAFSSCTALKNVSLPQVVEVSDYTFGDCKNIETLELPQATRFGLFIVSGCAALTQLKLTATGNFLYINQETGDNAIIGKSVFDNTPFMKPPFFSTKECTLILNRDKQADPANGIAPQANGNQWAGCSWKGISFE